MDSLSSIGGLPIEVSTFRNVTPPPESPDIGHLTMASVSRNQTSNLAIVTAEGDKVTLFSTRSSELSFATYNSKGESAGSTTAASAEFHSSTGFSVTVEGDLSKSELKDVRRAIKTVMKATRDVLMGHDKQAVERASKLSRLDQIASIDASVRFEHEASAGEA